MKISSIKKTQKSLNRKIIQPSIMAILLGLTSTGASAFEYCQGKIKTLIARDSAEATHVILDTFAVATPPLSFAKLGDGTGYNDFEEKMFSVLLSAFMSGKTVKLELNTNFGTGISCTNFTGTVPIRFVQLDSTTN